MVSLQGIGYVYVILVVTATVPLKVLADDCEWILPVLISKCKKFVEIPGPPTDPSNECCDAVKKADLPCICKHVPQEIMKFISMEKVSFVARSCGTPLPHGTKCGGYTVPPKA
ncbi:hypothetical protein J5N97_009145 [Dioscorea zingiberensis]|uniref:Bifunctional inhibitor/plant lipid transfer protein/seed storage helical domain-containing protein n=1 Tax=Dioscorea zingiberensis TaxID=325984 RepID=A0A9D5CYW8_9LILI|nr:hypothetical protein J5N97_009145 [Dioscorea zingiberensis]